MVLFFQASHTCAIPNKTANHSMREVSRIWWRSCCRKILFNGLFSANIEARQKLSRECLKIRSFMPFVKMSFLWVELTFKFNFSTYICVGLKKFISILLLFLYLLASIGFTVKAHYCGNDLASVSLFKRSSCCCEDNRNSQKDDCCKDEIKSFKIGDDQNINEPVKTLIPHADISEVMTLIPCSFYTANTASCANFSTPLHAPPDHRKLIPSWKLNHSFLFYCWHA
mgnify:CR=1 FL=1